MEKGKFPVEKFFHERDAITDSYCAIVWAPKQKALGGRKHEITFIFLNVKTFLRNNKYKPSKKLNLNLQLWSANYKGNKKRK